MLSLFCLPINDTALVLQGRRRSPGYYMYRKPILLGAIWYIQLNEDEQLPLPLHQQATINSR